MVEPSVRVGLFGTKELLIAALIVAVTGAMIAYKVFALGYSMTTLEEEDGYYIRLMMEVKGNGRNCEVKLALPISSDRQAIRQEKQVGDPFRYTISQERIGRWYAKNLDGNHTITYTCLAQTQARKYAMPEGQDIPTTYTMKLWDELAPEERTQVRDPLIVEKAAQLMPASMKIKDAVEAVFNYCQRDIRYLEVRGATDAVTALKLQEASCNGKVRLMVALLRARGIPARMANGVILERSRKRTTHAWCEAYIIDQWVPFCPTNDYFATIPETYLELAKGDVAVITRTRNIGFDWKWIINHQLNHREKAVLSNVDHPLNVLRAWTSLKDYHVSLDLIMVILMIPIAATVVSFARNVIGLVPFGTFMPALVAVAFRDTGFLLGALMFTTVIVVAGFVNWLLMKLRLLHIPRLTIIITVVVLAILGLSIVCLRFGITSGAAVSLFPMAILSLTSERFTMMLILDGWKEATKRLIVTFIVSSLCFLVINWSFVQLLLAAYPELLLVNISINLVIGSWTGLRLVELKRFRFLSHHRGQAA